jgi:hypothetical protein
MEVGSGLESIAASPTPTHAEAQIRRNLIAVSTTLGMESETLRIATVFRQRL